jgi:hypothetical protein
MEFSGWGSVNDMIPWKLGDRGRGTGVKPGKKLGERRGWVATYTGKNSRNETACQCIYWLSFERVRKTLKCLQVTSLKVEVQGWGSGAGKRKILRKEGAEGRSRKSQRPHPQTRKVGHPKLSRGLLPGHPPCRLPGAAAFTDGLL